MSNSPRNNEQDALITLTPQQLDPNQSKPTDFKVGKPDNNPPLPGHGQSGDTLAEARRLAKETADEVGFSKPTPIPDTNVK